LMDFNTAIEFDSLSAVSYANRGLAKVSNKDPEGAISDYNIAIKLNPKLACAYLHRGNARISLGRKNEGCEDLSKASILGDNDALTALKKECQ